MSDLSGLRRGQSYYEATARSRISGLLDSNSFQELLGPAERLTSPHLEPLGQPCSFNDGIIIGTGRLNGLSVLIASQEGGFMGGAVGEVHGAKLTGLLERAVYEKPAAVLLLLESGGVRLHEANAGLIAISEVIRALLSTRAAGIPVVGLIGGANGCFGGMGIVARCCDTLIINEEGRLGLSGPDVIETTMGVEEFDSTDRALVWRTVGGKHRYLLGEVQHLIADDIEAFRVTAINIIDKTQSPSSEPQKLTLESLQQEHLDLSRRLENYGHCQDGTEIWSEMGIDDPEKLPLMDISSFLKAVENNI
ncbi:MAG: biotin-independent malonate decarboxylase subunit beta [Candidatus Marinimicrobia bacterium]|nr:biotin-independent malonate decarboxylase subunit beta [Candidatus Neomarinimicrobiota bacterium]